MMPKPLRITDHDPLRVLDMLDRNGPLTFAEICREAQVESLAVNNGLYLPDELGPPFNQERMAGLLYRITKVGRELIRCIRRQQGDPYCPQSETPGRTLPRREIIAIEVGRRFCRADGDVGGWDSEPPGSECTVTSLKDGMVWYLYDGQKRKWGRCSKAFCATEMNFLLHFLCADES